MSCLLYTGYCLILFESSIFGYSEILESTRVHTACTTVDFLEYQKRGSNGVIFIKIHSNNSIADYLRSFEVNLSIGLDIWRVFSVTINSFQLMTPKFDSWMTSFDLTSCWSSYSAKNDLFVVEGRYLDM